MILIANCLLGTVYCILQPDMISLSVRNIGKMYPLYARPGDRLRQSLWYALPEFLRGQPKTFFREFWALRDISFELKGGESIGIIGQNGSGKSTLLQILAGTLMPTTGEVHLNGRSAALLELGSGFNPEFTGRENVYLNGAILGFSREEMDERFDDIAAFADIGEFLDQPVKLYSSGMYVRLAFSVQTCIEPDILIIDEVLSVGDIFFQQKCFARLDELLARNTAVVLVSHDMGVIEKYSSKTLLLDRGRSHFLGHPNEAVQRYFVLEQQTRHPVRQTAGESAGPMSSHDSATGLIPDWPDDEVFFTPDTSGLIGGESAVLCRLALCKENGRPSRVFELGDTAYFYYEVELLEDIETPVGGITLTNTMNINVHGKNTAQHLLSAPQQVKKGSLIRFRQTMRLSLGQGLYTYSIGFSSISAEDYNQFTERPYAYYHEKANVRFVYQQAGSFQIILRSKGSDLPFHGTADLPGEAAITIVSDG
jgi:lipopolysaccharide transport system ATP-binding protein